MTYLFDILLLGMAGYVLFAGISGKGRLYNVDNLKEGTEESFRKTMRAIFIGLGCAMLLNSVTSILTGYLYTYNDVGQMVAARELGGFAFLTPSLLRVLTYVFLGLTIAGVVLMIVMMRKFVDKEAVKKQNASGGRSASAANSQQAGHVLPVNAFEFDEESNKSDDDQKQDETPNASDSEQ